MQDYITKNQEEVTQPQRVRYWYELLPWLFLCLALPVSYFVWQTERAVELNKKDALFQQELNETSNQLIKQITIYEQALYGIRSLFKASEFVTEEEFRLFTNDVLHSNIANGLHEVGFAKLINPMSPKSYLRLGPQHQKEFMQLTQQALHAPVIYVASKHQSETRDVMPNAFDSQHLRSYMESTSRYNKILMTEPIGSHQDQHEGSLSMILPVYTGQKGNNDLVNVHNIKDTYGWLFLNLDLSAIFESVFEKNVQPTIKYSLHQHSVHKHGHAGEPTLLFSNADMGDHQSVFTSERTIALYGQNWDLHANSLSPFEQKLNYAYSNKIGLLALLITAALASILFLLVGRLRTFDRLKEVNHRLKLSDERWHFALEGSGDGVWDWDINNNQFEYSKRWKQMFGYEYGELEGTLKEWEAMLHPDDSHLAMRALQAYLRGEAPSYSIEYRLKCKDGTWKWVLSRGMVVARNAQREPSRMVGTHTDISQLRETEEQVWQQANFDHLTNLPNRRMLYARLEREMEKAKQAESNLALLFLDLDGFKEVNDTLGHDQGDVLLRLAAERLIECSFTHDVVARLGGDEFILLVTDIEKGKVSSVEFLAQKMLGVLAEPFVLKHEKAFVTASIGIAIFPDDSTTIDGLIKDVDQAMYASKDRGGNCFTYFTPEMQENSVNRLRLSNDLRLALEKQELFIEYQPIVELSTGDIYKAEALLRWQHAEKGLISPAEFIPIAEDTRLINDIGYWVFMESIKQCNAWRKSIDSRFQIAVNKSAVQFMNAETKHAEWINHLPVKVDDSNAIVVEVTESILLEASEYVGRKLEGYKKKGVQIALDDFGTGYSSLSYLREFDFDYLKIDKSFVDNLEHSAEDRVLCKAIIDMAHSLSIKVVAEGIETAKQLDVLVEAGCDYGQGWYFSKSLTPSAFETYVKNKLPH